MQWRSGETCVRWSGGGLVITHGGDAFVFDAPLGVLEALGPDVARVRAVLLSSGRDLAVSGLVGLLCALRPHRGPRDALEMRFVLGDERGIALAEAWGRAWGEPFPLVLDAEAPGGTLDLGPLEVELVPMRAGEPDWRRSAVVGRPQVALRVHTPDGLVVWLAGASPTTATRRACEGAALAVVEAGVVPWPRTEARWRLTEAEALAAAGEADTVWLVGDDGRPCSGHQG